MEIVICVLVVASVVLNMSVFADLAYGKKGRERLIYNGVQGLPNH